MTNYIKISLLHKNVFQITQIRDFVFIFLTFNFKVKVEHKKDFDKLFLFHQFKQNK